MLQLAVVYCGATVASTVCIVTNAQLEGLQGLEGALVVVHFRRTLGVELSYRVDSVAGVCFCMVACICIAPCQCQCAGDTHASLGACVQNPPSPAHLLARILSFAEPALVFISLRHKVTHKAVAQGVFKTHTLSMWCFAAARTGCEL
jgi:hypothetical protein